ITDPLTGLRNRRFLEETIREDTSAIQRELHDMRSGRRPPGEHAASMGIFMLDIDRFKKINDLYGHEAGDAVLAEIAARLQGMMRQSDTVVRWGGEEFLVLTRRSGPDDAFVLAERIRRHIEETAFPVGPGATVRKTLSVGFCLYPFLSGGEDKLSWAQAVALADTALYLAKHNGRNLAVGLQPGKRPFQGDGHELLADIPAAIAAGCLEVVSRRENLKIPSQP
ncbi:MAG: GGDEF domain-containing protein, partial [Candidatus Aminicenantes bacterium]|nr:GGDEF domain-containing protein [Candidatus Aminicenantes bacterium]